METIEYRTVDKSGWGDGPWQSEPDKRQWRDETTGLPCLIVRGPLGALCGYVGVSVGHPWHGKDYSACVAPDRHEDHEGDDERWHYNCTPQGIASVHGGLTFADGCGHGSDPSEGVCHIPGDGEPDDVWWLGFDCAHFGDFRPDRRREQMFNDGVYRDVDYVTAQVQSLARQLAAITA